MISMILVLVASVVVCAAQGVSENAIVGRRQKSHDRGRISQLGTLNPLTPQRPPKAHLIFHVARCYCSRCCCCCGCDWPHSILRDGCYKWARIIMRSSIQKQLQDLDPHQPLSSHRISPSYGHHAISRHFQIPHLHPQPHLSGHLGMQASW